MAALGYDITFEMRMETGMPPDPLPRWLPPGTRTNGRPYVAKTVVELRDDGNYWALWKGQKKEGWTSARNIDWANLPDPGPLGGYEHFEGERVYVPAKGEWVRVTEVLDDEPGHKVGDVAQSLRIPRGSEVNGRCCIIFSSRGPSHPDLRCDPTTGTYCLVEPLFADMPRRQAPAKCFDEGEWERARGEAEAAFAGAESDPGPSAVMLVNGQPFELKNVLIREEDCKPLNSVQRGFATLEDAVRAAGFVPGDVLVVDRMGGLMHAGHVAKHGNGRTATVGVAATAIQKGAMVTYDQNGRLVPVGSVTKPKKP